ncbi:MAG: 6,7-dimethyl-8-ribityllumazine synthase [Caulobacteraceae bacterium]|nr:6,7-dimethyl-8-ribityllumazine synthase [Caulobacteraceae bacterium]
MTIQTFIRPVRLAIVVSRFEEEETTTDLLGGAQAYLAEQGAAVDEGDIFEAPGAFDLPLIAQTLARTGRYEGVICLGRLIKGAAADDDLISLEVNQGLLSASLTSETPISFGVLTPQADAADGKGRQAARACHETALMLRRIREGETRITPGALEGGEFLDQLVHG